MTVLTHPADTGRAAPADLITGWDHLELWVGNARAAAQLLMSGFGFTCASYAGPETGVRDRVSYVLEQGCVRLVVTAGLASGSEVTAHVARHGDGVRRLGLATGRVDDAFESSVEAGAPPLAPPSDHLDADGAVRDATIGVFGSTELAFVDRSAYRGGFAPGFSCEDVPVVAAGDPVGLERIDHVVGNVEEGRLDDWVDWYRRVLGFREMRHFDADQISTEFSALRSTVMWNGDNVVMPLNEPAQGRRRSQIQEFLDSYSEPGVQHIALHTTDIVRAVDAMRRRGVRFLSPPATYYEDARRRCGDIDVPWSELQRLGVLVDVDGGGHLLQVFTETLSDRPTLFVEVIQREGATGFGEGNFKALFEAIERDQARRGNL